MDFLDFLPLIFSALAALFAFGIFLWGFLALLLKSFQAMLDAQIAPLKKDVARLEAGQAKLEAGQAKFEAKLESVLRRQDKFEIELKEIKSALQELLKRS